MKIVTSIFDMILDFVYRGIAPIGLSKKMKLLLQYIYFGCKSLIPWGNLLRSELLTGRKVFAASYYYFNSLFKEIFFRNIYYFSPYNKEKPIIIDAGANIGISALYFHQLYPAARIICFEPDSDTFKLLQRNTDGISNIITENYGLSDKNEDVTFYYNKSIAGDINASMFDRDLSFVADKKTVKVIKLSNYLKENYSSTTIDLLKMDIEGAEHKVLDDLLSNDCLRNIKQIVLEYHHYMLDSDSSSVGSFIKTLEDNDYDVSLCTLNFRLDKIKQGQNIFISATKKN